MFSAYHFLELVTMGAVFLAVGTTFVHQFAVHRATDFSGEKMKLIKVLALSLAMTAGAFAQSTSSELKELKDAIAAQQQQTQPLQTQVCVGDREAENSKAATRGAVGCRGHPAVAAAGGTSVGSGQPS